MFTWEGGGGAGCISNGEYFRVLMCALFCSSAIKW